jgi:hypothetical protein
MERAVMLSLTSQTTNKKAKAVKDGLKKMGCTSEKNTETNDLDF